MKKKLIYHGLLHDFIDINALIELQANSLSFLDTPKDYQMIDYNKYKNKPKVKKLSLSFKNEYNKDNDN